MIEVQELKLLQGFREKNNLKRSEFGVQKKMLME